MIHSGKPHISQSTNNLYINKALELYHQYCPYNKNYPNQIESIIKALPIDPTSLIVALLYTSIQHGFNLEKHKHHFNNDIIYLVDVVKKLSDIHNKPYSSQYISFHQLLLTIDDKLQKTAILTSLALLLHKVSIFNLDNDNAHSLDISNIITNCYIPYLLSHTLHNDLAYILQDLCFKIQYPEEYNSILHSTHLLYPDIYNIIDNINYQFRKIFKQLNIKASLSYRIKSPYSIWIKTLVKNVHITALNDIIGFRIIVPNKKACYDVSNIIHLHYNTITSEFVDYIRYPKNNGYQSIHLVISGVGKGNIEIQIRSTAMHRQTQFGSSHSCYKMTKYYIYRSNHNINFILYSITLNNGNKTSNYHVVISITHNNLCTNNTPPPPILSQYSSDITNNTMTFALYYVTTPKYIEYYNNDLLPFIKHCNTIDTNLFLNIDIYSSKLLEYTTVPKIIPSISSINIQLTNNYNYTLSLFADKAILIENSAPQTISYTMVYENSCAKPTYKLLLENINVKNKLHNESLDTANDQITLKPLDQETHVLSSIKIRNDINTHNPTKLSVLQWLVNPDITNIYYMSSRSKDILLCYAPQFDDKIIPLLIEHGADINAKNSNNDTVLLCTAESGKANVVYYLVEKGADINAKNKNNDTALYYAAKYGNLDVVRYLVEHGADINAKNNDNKTVLHFALEYKQFDIVKYLAQIISFNLNTCDNEILNDIEYTTSLLGVENVH